MTLRSGRILSLAAIFSLLAAAAWARVEVEAIPGRPYGVARIVFAPDDVGGVVDVDRLRVTDRTGRALYPSAVPGLIGKLLGGLLDDGRGMAAGRMHVSFLFRGDEPFDVSIEMPGRLNVAITPQPGRRGDHERLLQRWWKDYQTSLSNQTKDGDFPPLVQTYLLSLHAGRLGFPAPALPGGATAPTTESQRALEMMLGLEKIHDRTLQQTMLGPSEFDAPTDQPLPPPVQWPAFPLDPPADVPVEAIAKHVPAECFYIRFGRFTNYLWLDNLLDDYGGDLESMITMRAHSAPISERGEKQLGLEKNALADLFGETVISDVVLLGRDTFMREGGAFGILFEARNGLLANDIKGQLKRALDREKKHGATIETVKISGRDVTFLSTPDNRLRSFYAADGAYHLVTTSRAIIERFFEAGEGKGDLASTAEFRSARQQMPLTREDTVFAYFSTQFFQGLLSPQYQIELNRRMQAVTDMELVHLALAASHGEGVAGDDFPQLIAAGLLPKGFGKRPGGSGPVVTETGVVDSLRGPRGTFIPVPDVQIEGITKFEADRLRGLLNSLGGWGRLDPWMIGARRFALEDQGAGRERVIVDAHVMPLDEAKFGKYFSMIGPPTRQMVLPMRDDAVSVQAAIRGGLVFPSIPPHQMFLAIKDLPPLGDVQPKGLFGILQLLRNTPGYLGGWPKPGFIDLLPFGLAGQPDQFGFSQLPFGLARWQGDGFSVLAFDQRILADASRELRVVDAEIPAQLRVHAGDLSQSQVSELLNSLSYQRSYDASRGNTRLMHLLVQQFHTPIEEAKATAETLLDATLLCPLGGEYALQEERGDRRWVSTKWPPNGVGRPAEWRSPVLDWFRGLDLYLNKTDGGIFAHAELDLQRKPTQLKLELPPILNFNLFGSPDKAVKPAEPVDKPKPDSKTAPAPPKANEPKPNESGLKSVLKQPNRTPPPPPVDDSLPPPEKKPAKGREF